MMPTIRPLSSTAGNPAYLAALHRGDCVIYAFVGPARDERTGHHLLHLGCIGGTVLGDTTHYEIPVRDETSKPGAAIIDDGNHPGIVSLIN
jgi:hypothetical protein